MTGTADQPSSAGGETLLPCPFCGGPAVNVGCEYITCGAAWNHDCAGHQLRCLPCDWNRRASPQPATVTSPEETMLPCSTCKGRGRILIDPYDLTMEPCRECRGTGKRSPQEQLLRDGILAATVTSPDAAAEARDPAAAVIAAIDPFTRGAFTGWMHKDGSSTITLDEAEDHFSLCMEDMMDAAREAAGIPNSKEHDIDWITIEEIGAVEPRPPAQGSTKPAAREIDEILNQLEDHSPNWVAKIRAYISIGAA